MERESKLYQIRRKCQVLATKIFGYSNMTKVYYYIILKDRCNLKEPKNFNEKLCWLKLNTYNNNELVSKCTDKYLVREYVADKIGNEYLVPLIASWDDVESIEFDRLPTKFIMKCNHGCAYNIPVENKELLDKNKTKKQLRLWLDEDFSLFNAEPQYHYIKPKVICEKFLEGKLYDYKFFCINGKVEFYYVSEDLLNDRSARMKHYWRDGRPTEFQRSCYEEYDFEKTERVDEMIELAEKLSKPFELVRVDFFFNNGDIFFSELTFTPGGGYNEFEPKEWSEIIGNRLKI